MGAEARQPRRSPVEHGEDLVSRLVQHGDDGDTQSRHAMLGLGAIN